ncbi:AraC family transcriptional regulator [Lysobacteraceae bacterium NML120232]|nr:AraC family transcriptional regulator [Xanthomonadaceae bacterium NML08-0793]PJK13389.1 AraC family transcriptional regulator [Xanthomonadaceae bacterium NML120232]
MPLPTLEALTAYIRERLADNPSPAQIAAHFGVNRFALSRWFRARNGLSLREYIAALKIEQGIAPLVQGQSVIDAQLEAGHSSAATFAHRFRAHTGQSPRDYRAQAAAFSTTVRQALHDGRARVLPYHDFEPAAHPQAHALSVQVQGQGLAALVFVGLFPEPIPRGAPVWGRALFHARRCVIDHIPNGRYHLLGCEMRPSLNPLDFFRLDHCQRALHPEPITFPLPAPQTLDLSFRPLRPGDPPITVNLPKLLFDYLHPRNP